MTAFAELKQRQSVMWGAGPYERVSVQLREIHEHLLDRMPPRPGERWLDVATGTGEVARPVARAGAQVIGLDLAPNLIETARRIAAEEGLDIHFDVGDAEALPYEDASVDTVSSTFGVMFAPDHEAVARELARVCRPGGRLGLATWLPDAGVHDLFKLMAPFQPPSAPGAGSPFDWGREEHVEGLLGQAFELEFDEGDVPQVEESPEAFWRLMSTSYGPTKTLVASLDPERREELHAAWLRFFDGYVAGAELQWPRPYVLVLGRRR